VGTVTAPRWQLLSDNPDGRGRLPRWRLWADPGSSTRNWGAVFRLSSFDRDSNEGVAILRVRHISDFSRWACENSAAVLRIVGATRRVIRVE
jgi:hypothetical protein